MTRAEKVAAIRRYREAGYTTEDIAGVMGMSFGGVRNLVNDPDGSKQRARRARYQGSCETCGARTDGSNGRANAPRFCHDCWSESPEGIAARAKASVWSRDVIVARIREWAVRYGEAPAMPDWNPWHARNVMRDLGRAERFEATTHWPHITSVVYHFGSWNAAIKAAGFTPRANHGGGGNQHRRRDANGLNKRLAA